MVTIVAEGDTLHQRIIDVMNACAAAGIKNVTVGMGGDQ
jgi:biopolymer transport protein ExbD